MKYKDLKAGDWVLIRHTNVDGVDELYSLCISAQCIIHQDPYIEVSLDESGSGSCGYILHYECIKDALFDSGYAQFILLAVSNSKESLIDDNPEYFI